MRSYTNTLLFESSLDSIRPANVLLSNVAFGLFNPLVKVVESDCHTLLGTLVNLDETAVGNVELATGTRITKSRLSTISSTGTSTVSIRDITSCTTKGGVCLTCLSASRPRLSGSTVGSFVRINPELQVSVVKVSIPAGGTTTILPYTPSQYDVVYLYNDGTVLAPNTYSISDTTLTLSSPVGSTTDLTTKFAINSNVGYFYWLSNTYSGSLLGIKSLIELPLPVKPSLIRASINTTDINALSALLSNSEVRDEDFVKYIPSVKDPLEKAIFVVTLNSIFLN